MSLARHDGKADLHATREQMEAGSLSAGALLDICRAAAAAPAAAGAFIRRFDTQADAAAAAADRVRASGAPTAPLAGLPVSVKDLFDVAGHPTTGGALALSDAAAAEHDCSAVARLRRAGAVLVGHTNLSEFAFSGVGLNPHHGTPANAGTLAIEGTPRAPGGSTSGGATSVAAGAALAALGSDTGGSLRIPAALQGLVGFKATQRLTPLDGCIPLSASLDTSGAITVSVRDAVLLHEVLTAQPLALPRRPLHALRLALPQTLMLDTLEPEVAHAFELALTRLRAAGVQIEPIALPELAELAQINAVGGLPAAESFAWHRPLLARRGEQYDRRVALRIRRGAAMSAADYLDVLRLRRGWICRVEAALLGFDAALSPTVPMLAPPLAPLLSDDAAFFATNARLLRNPSVVNFLDGCALSLPCQPPGALPVGLMLWGPALHDAAVLGAGLAVEALLAAPGS